MKRLLFLFTLILGWGTAYSQCPTPEIAPYTETFTGVGTPACWTQSTSLGGPWVIGVTTDPDFGTNVEPGDHTNGSDNNYAWVDQSGGDAGVILQSPVIDVNGLTIPELGFWIFSHNNSGSVNTFNSIFVEASDGLGGWTLIDQITGDFGFQWVNFVYNISANTYGANLVQIRFRAESGGDSFDYDNDMLLDDFGVYEQPTCPAPSGIAVSNVTGSNADVTWTDNAGASQWEVEFGPVGYTPGTGTSTIVTTTTPNITGLSNSTDYTFCVRAICGVGDSSFWNCSGTITTPCGTFTAPFIESFATNSLPNCWTTAGPTTWEYGSSATTPTGPAGYGATGVPDYSTPATGTFIMMDGSDNTTGEVSSLTSPFIDVTTLTTPMMSYAVFYNNTNDNTLNELLVEFWDGASWNTIETINQNLGPNWVEFSTILAGFTITGDVQMRFTVTGGVGTPFYNDILLDDIEIKEAPPCPNPSGLTFVNGDNSSVDMSWTVGYIETEWTLEYGPVGFTPGTGTSSVVTTNPATITGMPANQFFDVYVYANCSVTDTSDAVGPVTVNTYNQGLYMVTNTDCPAAGFTDIAATGVLNTLGDDGEVTVTLPFNLLYQGTPVTDVTIGSNGAIVLQGGQQVGFSNGQMSAAANGLYPFWDDLGPEEAGEGVFYQTIGTAPNQQFIVQWNKDHLSGNGDTYIFQVVIDEATMEIFFVYDVVEVNSTPYDFGGSATIGVAGPNQDIQNSFNNTQYLTDNTCAHFYYTDCPNPQNYAVTYTTTDEAAITWNSGLANETNWTVVYGLTGFDPQTQGTTVQTTLTALIIPGLEDVTCYDVYIYADCNGGLQSDALFGTFCTLPNCADVTGLAGSTAVDSIFTSWNFTPNAGFPISEFAVEYGPTGFNNGSGTYVWGIDTVSYVDTVFDVTLMSGGLYDVYLQSICNTDSSNWVGPITVTMPLTNDSTCLAEEIPVNGTVYTFDGTGATVAAGETAIAPGAGTCTGTTTWCNSSMNFTTWFTFTAPASGNVRIDGEQAGFDGQIAVYETTDCSSFSQYTMLGANDDSPLGGDAPYLNLCGLTPGNTYYLVHDPLSTISTGIYSLRIQDVVVEAGTDNGLLNICLGDTVDLSTQLSGADAGGMWTESIATANFNDPIWVSAGLAAQVFDFEYMVVDGCATDSVSTQVEVYAPSSAGIDGNITVCLNEPVDLLAGLSGNVDFGGTWYDPSNSALPNSNITAGQVPNIENYDYITGNGVCPDDTSNVTLTILATCNYLNLQENNIEGIELYPNPTTNIFYISNTGSSNVYNYELTDLNGKVIASQEAAINGTETTEVSVEDFETGVYLIRIFNENDEKTFRVVKQ